jgi:HYR domain
MRYLVSLGAAMALALSAVPLAHAENTHGTVAVNGYGGVAERVFTPENSFMFATVGSHNGQPDLFVSAFPRDFSGPAWEFYFIPPAGPLVPGTYENAGGFDAWPSRPGLVVFAGFIGVCNGGTFTIHSLDTSAPFVPTFDVSWSQQCGGRTVSGRATFTQPPDTSPPVITFPQDRLFVLATSPEGAVVVYEDYGLTVRDDRDPSPELTCSPASGSTFSAGVEDQPVTCTAIDSSGNRGSISFTVTVIGAEGQLLGLRDVDLPAVIPGPFAHALNAELTIALEALRRGDTDISCRLLTVFIGRAATLDDTLSTAGLIASAGRVKAVLGCAE